MLRPVIVGIGQTYLEYRGQAEPVCRHGQAARLEKICLQPGGKVPLALATAASLGCRSVLSSSLPNDHAGRFVRDSLRAANIDIRYVVEGHGNLSPHRFAITQGPLQQSFETLGDQAPHMPAARELASILSGANLLLVADDGDTATIEACEQARKHNIPIVCDVSTDYTRLEKLLELATVLIIGEQLAWDFSRKATIEDMIGSFRHAGPAATIVTLGDAGCAAVTQDGIFHQPAFDVDVYERSGAGEVFVGALMAALLSELPVNACLRFATAAAAAWCQEDSSWDDIPSRLQIEALLSATPALDAQLA